MVYLAISPEGLKEALGVAAPERAAIWCGADAISEEDYGELRDANVSRFNYAMGDREPAVLKGALETIALHHPQQIVWLESATLNLEP